MTTRKASSALRRALAPDPAPMQWEHTLILFGVSLMLLLDAWRTERHRAYVAMADVMAMGMWSLVFFGIAMVNAIGLATGNLLFRRIGAALTPIGLLALIYNINNSGGGVSTAHTTYGTLIITSAVIIWRLAYAKPADDQWSQPEVSP